MKNYFLLSAVGPDKPGIVSNISKILFENGCNLEDSAMMRLGSEFGVMLIFTSPKTFSKKLLSKLASKNSLNLELKKISPRQAAFVPMRKSSAIVTVHGIDKPGLVYKVTQALAAEKFNITDLTTHRTQSGKEAGYILIIEGELNSSKDLSQLKSRLLSLTDDLGVQISINPIEPASL